MTEVEKIISLAKSELGYREGKNNITKYADFFDKQHSTFYNGKKQGVAWCDLFCDFLFVYTFGEERALSMLYQPKRSCGAGCKYSAQYYKAHNAFDRNPRLGDQIFFGRQGDESHTGIVVGLTPYSVTTIEGNSGNAVKQHTYNLTDSSIAGYGHPKYNTQPEIKVGYAGTWPTLPSRGYFMKGDKGVNVCRLQEFLKWYDSTYLPRYGVDGDFGTETKTAVISFEAREGIKTDGLFGPVCLKKAKEIKR